MDRGQNQDQQMPPQLPINQDPDIFLSFDKQDKHDKQPSPQIKEQNVLKEEEQPPNNLQEKKEKADPKIPGKKGPKVSSSITKEEGKKEPRKYKKRIKKKEGSSNEEESFTDKKKQKKKENPEKKSKVIKTNPDEPPVPKKRGKPKKVKENIEEVKQELQELGNEILMIPKPEKSQLPNKKALITQPTRANNILTPPTWQQQMISQEDFNSVEAQLCEDSIIHRSQNQTYRRMMELVNNQGDNLLQKIAELPHLLY